MKIMIVSNGSSGLYGFRKELIKELLKKHEVYLLTRFSGFEVELKDLGCKMIELSFNRRGKNLFGEISLIKKIYKILKSEKTDYVITYTIKPNIYAGICARLLKIPYSVNITGLGTAFEKKGLFMGGIIKIYRFGLKKASSVFFENDSNKSFFIDHNIIKDKQAVLLSGAGVNLDYFYYSDYPKKNTPFIFLYLGRSLKQKDSR